MENGLCVRRLQIQNTSLMILTGATRIKETDVPSMTGLERALCAQIKVTEERMKKSRKCRIGWRVLWELPCWNRRGKDKG